MYKICINTQKFVIINNTYYRLTRLSLLSVALCSVDFVDTKNTMYMYKKIKFVHSLVSFFDDLKS